MREERTYPFWTPGKLDECNPDLSQPSSWLVNGCKLLIQGPGLEEVDERELSDHKPDSREENSTVSIVKSNYAAKSMQAEQFGPEYVDARYGKSNWAFNMESVVIQPRLSFFDSGFEPEFGSLLEEYFIFHRALSRLTFSRGFENTVSIGHHSCGIGI